MFPFQITAKTFSGVNGICLKRFPVKDAKALDIIAPINGGPVSPIPVGFSVEGFDLKGEN